MKSSKIPRSMLKLSELASFLHIPDGVVSTGWGVVEEQCERLGITFDTWQAGLGSLLLGKRSDGVYAAGIGGACMSIPRQVGKTYLVGWMLFAMCLLHENLFVVWTAHRTRTSDETYASLSGMARNPSVIPFIRQVRGGNGKQAIEFANGSRILFGAREQGFGRGFASIDVEIFDEAQILTESALSDMVPAANAATNGLVLYMGTPPRPKDPGEAFTLLRNAALSGDPDTLWVEFSADPECGVDHWDVGYVDWRQLEKANPSYPHRTSRESVLRMRKQLGSNESFRREALGIWDTCGVASRLISERLWESTIGEPPDVGVRSFAVAFSRDGERQAIVGVVKHPNGVHANLIGTFTGSTESGVAAVADWLAERWRDTGMIALAGAAGSAVLAQALSDRGVPARMVHIVNTREYVTACQMLMEAIKDGALTRPRAASADDALDASVAVCDARSRGRDGAWGWESSVIDGDETPIEALSVGVWAARANRRKPGKKQVILV